MYVALGPSRVENQSPIQIYSLASGPLYSWRYRHHVALQAIELIVRQLQASADSALLARKLREHLVHSQVLNRNDEGIQQAAIVEKDLIEYVDLDA